ncbi:MAG: O-acetyl-ADP-ribose deacetylase [Acidobacteriia bacterium]|nr:O-acetyl-ADP-ribose deacetylase [Terriglobia bacterium]
MRIAIGNDRIITFQTGDITVQDTDAVVNAANEQLAPGGGVCGAIHRAGGPAIWNECETIVAKRGPLPTGQAVATAAGKMKARYVIHTVGPVWHGGQSGEPEKLASCYRESIRVADELKLTSIAFPSISTGIFGYPVAQAAPVALQAVAAALRNAQDLREVRFVLFDPATADAYTRAAANATYGRPTQKSLAESW